MTSSKLLSCLIVLILFSLNCTSETENTTGLQFAGINGAEVTLFPGNNEELWYRDDSGHLWEYDARNRRLNTTYSSEPTFHYQSANCSGEGYIRDSGFVGTTFRAKDGTYRGTAGFAAQKLSNGSHQSVFFNDDNEEISLGSCFSRSEDEFDDNFLKVSETTELAGIPELPFTPPLTLISN